MQIIHNRTMGEAKAGTMFSKLGRSHATLILAIPSEVNFFLYINLFFIAKYTWRKHYHFNHF